MPILQYETRVSPEGYIVLPPIPEYRDRKVVVRVHEESEEHRRAFSKRSEGNDMTPEQDLQQDPTKVLPNGKTPVEDFLDFCKELNLPSLTDEEAGQVRFDALMEKYG